MDVQFLIFHKLFDNITSVFLRGLRFIQVLLQSLADGERDEDNPNLIRINITKAYDQALKRYHGWIVQKVFKVGVFCSYVCMARWASHFVLHVYGTWKILSRKLS